MDYKFSNIQEDKPEPFEIRKSNVKGKRYYKDEDFGKRNIFGKIKHGIKNGGKFLWKNKKLAFSLLGCSGLTATSIFGIPLSSIITLTQTTTQMEQLLSNLPVIISLIIAIGSLLYAGWTEVKKNGILSLFQGLSDDIDDVYKEVKNARKKNSEGGSSITKKELLDILGKVDVHSDNLKKKKDKLDEQSK